MSTNNKVSRILGVAFLLQFVTSFGSGSLIKPAWLASGDITATLRNIAANPWLVRANILADMLTALGVIFLGAILFVTLRKQNEKIALVGLGFYILEAGLLAASRLATFSLLRIGQAYGSAGQPEYMLTLGNLAVESMEFVGGWLHMLAFCIGAILFYYLLYQSRLIPHGLSLWGLIAVVPPLIGTLTAVFGYEIPFVFFLPYFPFEFVIGIWIVVRGIPETRSSLASMTERPAAA
jgi:hypothetical protein